MRALCYVFPVLGSVSFAFAFAYAVGFLLELLPRTPGGADGSPSVFGAVAANVLLVGLFGLQHSVMARQGFKEWWTRLIPAPIERSVYVMISSCLLVVLLAHWQPVGGVLWDGETLFAKLVAHALFAVACATLLLSMLSIGVLDLLGFRQVFFYVRDAEYVPLEFSRPTLYRYVRHPMMFGTLLVFWLTPAMSVDQLVLAAALTVYVLVGIRLEERDLVALYGRAYEVYRSEVPMLLPWPRRRR